MHRVCVCVSKHHTVAYVSSATLFALLRGPSVHDGLEAKKTFCLLSAGDGGQRSERPGLDGWLTGSPIIWFDYAFFPPHVEAQSPSLLLAPPSLPALLGFCTLTLICSPSLWPHELSLCGLFASNQYESCASSKHKQPPFFLSFFYFCVLCKSLSSLMWICVFFLCLWVKTALRVMVCPPNHKKAQSFVRITCITIYFLYIIYTFFSE